MNSSDCDIKKRDLNRFDHFQSGYSQKNEYFLMNSLWFLLIVFYEIKIHSYNLCCIYKELEQTLRFHKYNEITLNCDGIFQRDFISNSMVNLSF